MGYYVALIIDSNTEISQGKGLLNVLIECSEKNIIRRDNNAK